jgi:indolepyruvate ferredoxin oxidoreductase
MTDIAAGYSLSDRYMRTEGQVLLTGIQALARLPIEQLRLDRAAGRNTAAFLSGYPGSPLGGFDQEVARAARLVPDLTIVLQPGVNEELGATSVMGSQLAAGRPDALYEGVVGFWYGKAPGVDRASDALRHAVFAGTSPNGGAVALVGDDPAAKSSTLPSSSDATMVDLHMPVLYPGTIQECLELGLHAVAISRAAGLWSAMKIVTAVADGSGLVRLPVLAEELIIPTIEVGGRPYVCKPSAVLLGPRMLELEREFREIRLPLAERYGVENRLNSIPVNPSDAWIGLVSTGYTYYQMLEALRRLGLPDEASIADAGIRLLHLRMPIPFDRSIVRQFARGLDDIVVVEEKNPTLETLVRDALYGTPDRPSVVGKNSEDGRTLLPAWGMLDADAMVSPLRERLSVRLADRLAPVEAESVAARKLIPLSANRSPFFCSGCPHNWGTKVPEGSLVGAGIGCHGMTLLMDEERVGETTGITAMGNEGSAWAGMAPFVETDHYFQNFGDGTFFHSGQLSLQYAVAAGLHMTFKILYNGTVAMTGGQNAPGNMSVPDLVTLVLTHGVTKVAITTEDPGRYKSVDLPRGVQVHDRDDIVAVQEDLRDQTGVTVLIHDQHCAAELRRSRRRGKLQMPGQRIVINHRICEGCGDCGDVSNCLSVQPVETPFGRKTTIDQASCNFDYSCVKGDCPAFMTVDPTGADESTGALTPGGEVPDPVTDPSVDLVRVRMAGIGGTGIVTVAQIVATAAMFDGWEVSGLDQTGLSQKAGPVVSDVIFSRGAANASNLIGVGEADLILGFDALAAAGDNVVNAGDPQRTAVIASTHPTPTGAMVSHPERPYPDQAFLAERFAAFSRAASNRYVEASVLADALVGSASQANVFLLGVAVQAGELPLSVDAIEQAIDLNGVAVEANLAAFGWGRRWAHDAAAVEALATPNTGGGIGPTATDLSRKLTRRLEEITDDAALRAVLSLLTADLVGYQDAGYASSFLDEVAKARNAERRVSADSTVFTETVARSVHKLMAYKDEYEVARLMLAPAANEMVESVGGAGATFHWHLHPPMLKALGLDKKIPIGSWATPAIKALRAGKRLRGTRLDPFGRTEMRRLERELAREFRAALAEVYPALTTDNHAEAVAMANLPDLVRGYEDLKLRRVAEYRLELSAALEGFRTT